MGFISKVKGWFKMLLARKAKEEFNIKSVASERMKTAVELWGDIYTGIPPWVDPDNHIFTINAAQSIAAEIGRLTTMGIGVHLEGSARANYLQSVIDSKVYYNLREWVEYASAYGTVILKPTLDGVDLMLPGAFIVTEYQNGEIRAAAFVDQWENEDEEMWYTRIEYHRFLENGNYAVSNRCFIGSNKGDVEKRIDIEKTPWAGMAEDVEIMGIDRPLFGVLKTPGANNIDIGGPLGLSMFASAIQELKDLDIAYSRNSKEIFDSKRIVLMDSDRLLPNGYYLNNSMNRANIPDYIKIVDGDGSENSDVYHEINPSLNTDARLSGINALLSQIGFKCGFSNGYFVFNEKSGMVTATQVEADDRRTIQLIKDVRDCLEDCLNGLIYALDKMADLYGLAPLGVWEAVYDFGDITYSYELDKQTWWKYVQTGKVPFWYYLVKFEGMTEEDAKELEAMSKPKETLFGEEE